MQSAFNTLFAIVLAVFVICKTFERIFPLVKIYHTQTPIVWRPTPASALFPNRAQYLQNAPPSTLE